MKREFSGIRQDYYRGFLCLVVVPITIIMLVTLGILYYSSSKDSVEKVRLAHENVSSSLSGEIRQNSLLLSSFLLTNSGQALELASRYNLADDDEKFTYANHLTQLFNTIVIPERSVVAIHFYMKNGNHYELKNDLAVPVETLRGMDWYEQALGQPGMIHVDVTTPDIIYTPKNDRNIPIVYAMAPEAKDRYGQIEMVCMYTNSGFARQINTYVENGQLGFTYLANNQGEKIFTAGEAPAGGAKAAGNLRLITSEVKKMGWVLATAATPFALSPGFLLIAFAVLSTSAVVFLLFFLFSRYYLRDIINPLNTLIEGMHHVQEGDLEYTTPVHGKPYLQTLLMDFNTMTGRIRTLMTQNEQKEQEKYQAQIQALQAQINPHFLANTLNSIRFIAMAAQFDSIRDVAGALIEIMDSAMQDPDSFHTVAEEIGLLKSYLSIVEVRYPNFFEMELTVEPEATQYYMPRLVLQPIVENAIQHGLPGRENPRIQVGVSVRQGTLEFTVEDNGIGMSEQQIKQVLAGRPPASESKRASIGLYNVNRRLQLRFGEGYGLDVESVQQEYTRVIMRLPAEPRLPEGGEDSAFV